MAIATGARIVPRFEELSEDKLGTAGKVEAINLGTTSEHLLVISDCSNSKAVSILVRGATKTIVEEAQRCIHDALCVTRNLIRANRIVFGGGSIEVAAALEVDSMADQESSLEQ